MSEKDEPMRAAKAAPRPQIGPPPSYRQHEVTLWLPDDVWRTAKWAFHWEQTEDDEVAHLYRNRTFQEFLSEALEWGLETTVERWRRKQA